MKNQATFTALSLIEQATIIGGENTKPKPKFAKSFGSTFFNLKSRIIIQ